MKYLVTLLVTSMMSLHAGLGCCAHHDHHTVQEVAACESHDCHGHHEDSSSEEHPARQDCDEDQCVFVGQKDTSSPALSLFDSVAPFVVVAVPALDTNIGRIQGRAAWEDSLHPVGPALHLWLGVLVV